MAHMPLCGSAGSAYAALVEILRDVGVCRLCERLMQFFRTVRGLSAVSTSTNALYKSVPGLGSGQFVHVRHVQRHEPALARVHG